MCQGLYKENVRQELRERIKDLESALSQVGPALPRDFELFKTDRSYYYLVQAQEAIDGLKELWGVE